MANPTPDTHSVSRTFRAAIRLGEDFVTLEETITLPIDASDEVVQQAVDLGWRIYTAQREAVTQQVATIREAQGHPGAMSIRDPDAPASEKQRNYIAALQEDLSWNNEQLSTYADEQQVDLVTMTKGQASTFIDSLKKVAEERQRYSVEQNRPRSDQPASDKQLSALARLAHLRGIDLDAETTQRFGVLSSVLTDEQARILLSEWQAKRK
ncbi:hypothetical protein OSCT_2220 [Oscillochloris trichoides DG-6]|uniref:Uncharacterized protein n=1 Tax=Oscillochloris trichoides DG-6 TaxID=765420 RepID=E1IFW9_9CHLR|nr:hypothetical protein [Oscillochloris trichoides]EFO79927.1 hypothetical protein OSCT_2220 [Oscillochloris trichoides DG-6]